MKIIINGYCGRMGKEVAKLCEENVRGAELFCGIDVFAPVDADCVTSFDALDTEGADCVIDFSHHSQTEALLKFCVEKNLPVVLATTGQDEKELELINDAAKKIPVFRSANMSLGVALLCELAIIAAKTMPDADIEIIEKHHNRKLDAPSGTALLLADAISKVREKAYYVFGRGDKRKREKNEIGIHAVRMGNIVGEHEVIIGTDTQTITLKHEAHTRALFAEGAVSAAEFMLGKPAGFYCMDDIVKQK